MKRILLSFCSLISVTSASQLEVYDDTKTMLLQRTTDQEEIKASLNSVGIRFEQWEATQILKSSSTGDDIQEAYREDIERLKAENGFQSVDVVRMSPDHPQKVAFRQKFLNEHTHDEPEVRFFVEGSGRFFLHVEGRVYSVLCEQGDLISVPEGYCHWFDMGSEPFFTAIRFFTRTDGWIAHFTGNPISEGFVND